MTIAFIHPQRAFMPEIEAYTDFFSKYGVRTLVCRPEGSAGIQADIEWHFMGMAMHKQKSRITIHEYTSASVPPFNRWKDGFKRLMNAKPDYRLFLNEYVKQRLGFNDAIPFGYRDMGIAPALLQKGNHIEKAYDFIYAGSIDPKRKIERLLDRFTRNDLKKHSLLVLSKDYDHLARRFNRFENIQFKGPLAHKEVYAHIAKARFAINYLSDTAPFNRQTSTKLLEYAALQVPVISTDYAWVRDFQQKQGGDFFYLKKDLSNFSWENISSHHYAFPNLGGWTWEQQIRKSGVLQFLQSRFPGLPFD